MKRRGFLQAFGIGTAAAMTGVVWIRTDTPQEEPKEVPTKKIEMFGYSIELSALLFDIDPRSRQEMVEEFRDVAQTALVKGMLNKNYLPIRLPEYRLLSADEVAPMFTETGEPLPRTAVFVAKCYGRRAA